MKKNKKGSFLWNTVCHKNVAQEQLLTIDIYITFFMKHRVVTVIITNLLWQF